MAVTPKKKSAAEKTILLPEPKTRSRFSVERALLMRRSIRDYTKESLTLEELTQLLWSCQGITSAEGFRTTPSAGAVYPLEIYAVVERVDDLPAGVYHYLPGRKEHRIESVKRGHFGKRIFELSTKQDFIKDAAVNIILATVTSRMEKQYGEAALRYVLMEMGHAAQNIHIQAEALGLGSVAVGYLNEKTVQELMGIEAEPLYMVSAGKKKGIK
ncbi:SagB/ThcOx family dehydrogenase [candidate division KSB1 bacterium]|nr:MAG: SagB/ThcOx family dehydrogenase [candidate division KSB1 bacterium]